MLVAVPFLPGGDEMVSNSVNGYSNSFRLLIRAIGHSLDFGRESAQSQAYNDIHTHRCYEPDLFRDVIKSLSLNHQSLRATPGHVFLHSRLATSCDTMPALRDIRFGILTSVQIWSTSTLSQEFRSGPVRCSACGDQRGRTPPAASSGAAWCGRRVGEGA